MKGAGVGFPGKLAVSRAERRAVFAVTALAVVQPIFDQFGRTPEFLAAAGFGATDVWALALGLFLGLPALIVLVAEGLGRAHPSARILTYRLWLLLGLGLLTLLGLGALAPGLATVPALLAAAIAAAVGVRLHARRRAVRHLGNVLSLLVWTVPVLFLLRPEIRALHRPSPVLEIPAPSRVPPPVVLVIWDELPVSTLLTESGEIDADWFPSFARLAATSTWYRDALATGTMTTAALPGILSGRNPNPADLPTALADPRNVFRLVERSHERTAYSSVRGVAHDVRPLGDARAGRWAGWASDLGVLYLHLVLPLALRERLPPVSAGWGGFMGFKDEAVRLQRAIESLGPTAGEKPLFAYLHSSLPHHPWSWLPSGSAYPAGHQLVASGFLGVAEDGAWATEPWPVVQAYQRHVLQTMYTDTLLGRLIDRLRASGLWDSALVVVTADHGASFEAGLPLRAPIEATAAEVGAVPLFVKLPGQTEAKLDDRRAWLVDLLPTIADVCGLRVPWPLHGVSLLSPAAETGRVRWLYHPEAPPLRVDGPLLADVLRVAAKRRRAFAPSQRGPGKDPFQIGPFSVIVGRPLGEIPVRPSPQPLLLERQGVDVDARAIPYRLEMSLLGAPEGLDDPVPFAVAVGDEIVATTMTLPGAAPSFSVILPERTRLRDIGSLRVFRISGPSGSLSLEEVPISTNSFRIAADGSVVAGDGRRWTVEPGSFRGAVHTTGLPPIQGLTRTLAWAVDDRDRPPIRLVAFSQGRSVVSAEAGVPEGDFLDLLSFKIPEDRVFYLLVPENGRKALRFIALGADGRAGEISLLD